MATTKQYFKVKNGLEFPSQDTLSVTTSTGPSIRPSLLLDFANSKVLDPRVTFDRASTATYFDTNGVMQTALSNVPRFDHDPVTGESKGLLIEESRTNLLTYSEQFDNAVWAKTGLTVAVDQVVAPNGTLTADKLVEGTANSGHNTSNMVVTTNTTAYTASVFVKAGERRYVMLYANNPGVGQFFDLQTGTKLGIFGTAPTNATISPVGNGWYRLTITATTTSTNSSGINIYLSTDGVSTISYTGDGTSGIYIWGAQLEAGAFSTSYIHTTSAQVTRAADVASMTGTNFSSWYNQSEGTIYAEYDTKASTFISVLAGNGNNSFVGLWNNTNVPSTYNGTVILNGSGQNLTSNKIATSYSSSGRSILLNGGTVSTDANSFGSNTQMLIGQPNGAYVSYLNGHIKRIAYYPKRLSNTELQGITS